MISDIELSPTYVDVEWLCEIWAGLETYPCRFSHLHGIWMGTPIGSPIYDEIRFVYEVACEREKSECL